MIVWLFLAFLSLLGLQHETEAAGNLLWKFDTKYGISSTPTWSSDVNRLYFVSKLGVLFCLDPSSGDRLWAFRTPVLEIYSLTSSPLLYTLPETSIQNNATSAVVSGTGIEGIDGHLCDGGDSSSPQNKRKKVFIGGMYSVDACTGEQLWHTQLEHTLTSTPSVLLIKRYRLFRESFNASNTNNTSDSSSNTNTDSEAAVPVLFAGSSKGELFALDAHTGQLQFRKALVGEKSSTPAVSSFYPGGIVVTGTRPSMAKGRDSTPSTDRYANAVEGFVYAFNASTGAQLWRYSPRRGTAFIAAPTIGPSTAGLREPPIVYVCGQHPDNYHAVYALDLFSGRVMWVFPTLTRITASVVASHKNNAMHNHSNRRYQHRHLQATLGEKRQGDFSFDYVYVAALSGQFYSVHARNGSLVWNQQLDSAVNSAPVLGPNNFRAYVGTTLGTLYCFDRRSGVQEWEFKSGSAIIASPVVIFDNNTVVLTNNKGAVYSLDGDFNGRTTAPTAAPTAYEPPTLAPSISDTSGGGGGSSLPPSTTTPTTPTTRPSVKDNNQKHFKNRRPTQMPSTSGDTSGNGGGNTDAGDDGRQQEEEEERLEEADNGSWYLLNLVLLCLFVPMCAVLKPHVRFRDAVVTICAKIDRLIDRASKSRARTGRGRRGRRVGVDPGTVRGTSRPLHLTGLAQQCDRSPRTDNGTSAVGVSSSGGSSGGFFSSLFDSLSGQGGGRVEGYSRLSVADGADGGEVELLDRKVKGVSVSAANIGIEGRDVTSPLFTQDYEEEGEGEGYTDGDIISGYDDDEQGEEDWEDVSDEGAASWFNF